VETFVVTWVTYSGFVLGIEVFSNQDEATKHVEYWLGKKRDDAEVYFYTRNVDGPLTWVNEINIK